MYSSNDTLIIRPAMKPKTKYKFNAVAMLFYTMQENLDKSYRFF